MLFNEFERERQFRDAWDAVTIVRSVPYALFTFGESVLPYYLICDREEKGRTLAITQGDIRVTRPMIITPDTMHPEFRNFFENLEGEDIADFLLARTAAFSNLKFDNETGTTRIVSDNLEEAVAKLNRHLDDADENRVTILTAPQHLAGVALLRYTAERIWSSAPDNLQELRERGFLP